MSDQQSVQAEPAERTRSRRRWLRLIPVFAIMAILLGVPWWTLFAAGKRWPTAVAVAGTVVASRRCSSRCPR